MSYAIPCFFPQQSKLTKSDLAIAKQRIECAIYAFGGSVTRKQPQQQPQPDKRSIFRTRESSSSSSSSSSNATPSSYKSSSQGGVKRKGKQPLSRSNSQARREKYEKRLRQQYFEHGNRLSWDVQANLSLTLHGAKTFDDDDGPLKRSGSAEMRNQRKNRCKKCGQIKQGHICPYQSSLQRSIGIMVYPSANAHVADEPGGLAPALRTMNNFIPIRGESFEQGSGGSSTSGGREGRRRQCSWMKAKAATPATNSVGKQGKKSAIGGAIMEVNPFRRKSILGAPAIAMCTVIDDKRSDEEEERDGKGDEKGGPEDLLFQPEMEVTPDQYRAVTPHDQSSASSRDYAYPQVPLTFTQRKSMSDALFSLSRLVPRLTDECASVLTEARRRDQWDLAVAELMAQVVCVLHCGPMGDRALDGLRRYLMALGIVC